jgi:hypothetical protein
LPPSCTDFARGLKHKPKNFTFDELLVVLRIKEKYRDSQQQKSLFFKLKHML